jgi:hypothetical protein
MRTGIIFEVSPSDCRRLERVVRDRNAAQKHVWRASIILLSADGVGTAAIMRHTGKSKTCVWRWQERFMAEGVDGLLRDKTRPSRIAPLAPEVVERVVALTLTDAPGETTHWTAFMIVKSHPNAPPPLRVQFCPPDGVGMPRFGGFWRGDGDGAAGSRRARPGASFAVRHNRRPR